MSRFDRRSFLKGGAAALVGVSTASAAQDSAAPTPFDAPAKAGADGNYLPQALTAPDMVILKAAINRLIPADELTPAASDLGIDRYIDRQLAGPFGAGARWYMQGPFAEGLPTQGYQSRRTPAQLIQDGLRALDAESQVSQSAFAFADLQPEQQDAMLSQLESGELALADVDGKSFFKMLLQLTQEGFMADPMYGGNRDMAGWKLVGFPGARGNYLNWVDKTDQRYPFPPVSIMGS